MRGWVNKISQWAAALGVVLLLLGCAVKPRYPAGLGLLQGETLKLPLRPDSLRAELELMAFDGGRKSSVSGAFSCLPRREYKLDLFGLPGMVAASFLWTPEKWTLVLFDRENFVEDTGEHVEFGTLGIHEVSVHDVFSFLWGDFFSGYTEGGSGVLPGEFQRDSLGVLQYHSRGQRWSAKLEAATGLVREVVREDSAFRIDYSEYKLLQGRPIPRKTRLYSRTGLVLEIKVKNVEDNPQWKRNPFFVKVPKDFHRLESGSQKTWKK